MEGCIFDIQRFSVHDGPGIRTTVFFKGCNLRCLWCHNPESIHPYPEIQEFHDKCIGCGRCLQVCPANAILLHENKKVFHRSQCLHCGKCAAECFAGARVLAGRQMSMDEVIKAIERDAPFYKNSGGGVTFSGGDPLLQKDFLKALLVECKKRGLHTAVDTAGNMPWEVFEEILPFTDLFLYDMKVMDEDKHKQVTGVGNKRILENLRRLADGNVELFIRIPVIPRVNDNLENMKGAADFISALRGVKAVELLSFHHLGEGKYKSLGRDCAVAEYSQLSKEKMEQLGVPFIERSLMVKIC